MSLRFLLFHTSIYSCILLHSNTCIFSQILPSSSGYFIENKGQILDQYRRPNEDVLFLYSGKGFNIQLRKNGYSYELFDLPETDISAGNMNTSFNKRSFPGPFTCCRMDIDFINSLEDMEVVRACQSKSMLNYYIDQKPVTGIPSYNKITYKNIFPHTDIEFIINSNECFKYNIILNKGSDINNVKFLLRGIKITKKSGSCISYSNAVGTITENIPASYYNDEPKKKEDIAFKIDGDVLSFSGRQNPERTLIIDPSSNRIWGTYYGGSSLDYCTAVKTDAMNNIYTAGYTSSTSAIATTGSYQSVISGGYDVFLVKLDQNGNRIWASYFGGPSVDAAYGLEISAPGNIYLCGETFSTSGISTSGAHQPAYGGGIDDALLIKFDSSGQLNWATYYGGPLHDIASAVVEDSSENIIVCGHTESSVAIATSGAYSTTFSGSSDAFIAKFNSSGLRQWGSYYGETDFDEALSVDCDSSGQVYITGFTTSSNNIATAGGFQTAYSGQQDAFLAKFNSAGTTLLYGTYYGGPGNDQGTAIKTDRYGNIVIAGNTTSLTGISTTGSYQQLPGSADDGFIARFSSSGTRLWGTYFGGNDVDYISALAIDGNNNFFVCGSTLSTDAISSDGAFQPAHSGTIYYDSYFERFGINGEREAGSYYGGPANDRASGITLMNNGNLVLTGITTSSSDIGTAGAFDTTWAGGDDGFVARFCLAPEPVLFPSGLITRCFGDTACIIAPTGFGNYLWNNGTSDNLLFTSGTAPTGEYDFVVEITDVYGCSAFSDTTVVVVDICTSIHNIEEPYIGLFPIPARDHIFVELENIEAGEEMTFEIFSSCGALVSKKEMAVGSFEQDIREFAPGIYLIQVNIRGSLIRKRFIKSE